MCVWVTGQMCEYARIRQGQCFLGGACKRQKGQVKINATGEDSGCQSGFEFKNANMPSMLLKAANCCGRAMLARIDGLVNEYIVMREAKRANVQIASRMTDYIKRKVSA